MKRSSFSLQDLDPISAFSQMSSMWLTPLLKLGSKRSLELDDMAEYLPAEITSRLIFREMKDAWDLELMAHKQNSSFSRVIRKVHLISVLWNALNLFSYMFFVLIQPFFIQELLTYIDTGDQEMFGIKSGVALAVIFAFLSILQSIIFNYSSYLSIRLGVYLRSAVILMVFDKSLRLSSASRSLYTTGEIMTLMSVDSERLMQGAYFMHWLWMAPIMIIIAMILLSTEVSWAAASGAAALLVLCGTQNELSKMVGKTRKRLLRFTDSRLKVMNEALQAIRMIKLCAWEIPIIGRIEALRKLELKEVTKFQLTKLVNTVSMFLIPVLVSFAVFITYARSEGRIITLSKVYGAYLFIYVIRMPVMVLPRATTSFAEMNVSIDRITRFLLLDEIDSSEVHSVNVDVNVDVDVDVEHKIRKAKDINEPIAAAAATVVTKEWTSLTYNEREPRTNNDRDNETEKKEQEKRESVAVVDVRNADYSWLGGQYQGRDSLCLADITLNIHEGEFVAVVGCVASGKSSLVAALLGHIHRVSGTQTVKGKVAFVPQEPWIQNRSLRDNILFDSPLEEDKYTKVVQNCCLNPDLLMLPDGDNTEIGERGINLSGGQRARVSIARALYAPDVDLHIFDDPLAAVDAHVSRHLFEEVFCTMLAHKTRIVVMSSNYHLLPRFDKVVVMLGGSLEYDTYDNIIQKFPQFNTANGIQMTQMGDNKGLIEVRMLKEVGPSKSSSSDVSSSSDCDTETREREREDSSSKPFNSLKAAATATATATGEQAKAIISKNLIVAEDREKGAVTSKTYLGYFSCAWNKPYRRLAICCCILLLFIGAQILRVIVDFWVGKWAEAAQRRGRMNNWVFIYPYVLMVVGLVMMVIFRSYSLIIYSSSCSRHIHRMVLNCVLRAPINTFYDVTPMGRIVNRFSKDLDSMDSLLPDSMNETLQFVLYNASIVVICTISVEYMAIVFVPAAMAFGFIHRFFNKSSREIKRLEGVSRSPLYSLFEETLQGLSSIRAYNRCHQMMERHFIRTDNNARCYFCYWVANRWLSIRLDLLCTVIILAVGVLAVVLADNHRAGQGGGVDENLVGLALLYSMQLTGLLQYTVRLVTECENNMTSVERLLAYTSIPSEAASELPSDPSPEEWPSHGEIVIRQLSMRYRPGLPLVLNNLNITIAGGSKVGICGRTGSGKSSLLMALCRIIEPEEGSSVCIDGIDTLAMGLRCLRSSFTVIPQDPVLFSGTLRYNLDPLSVYTDEQIWAALESSHMKDEILDKYPEKLLHVVSDRGENISLGQRQLLCMARALLRRSKLIILDEATASVDTVTDRIVEVAIKTVFRDCTVLTIAHRLETIADNDMIAVMHQGRVAEYGHPATLLQLTDGLFRALVDEQGVEVREAFYREAAQML